MKFKDCSLMSNVSDNLNNSNSSINNKNYNNIQPSSDNNNQNCLFCQIINHQISVRSVFEDDYVIAILDINPANKGHVLVIPKRHYTILPQMDNDIIKHIFVICKKISQAVIAALKADGTNIYTACGRSAGQTSHHALIHIIPRFNNDDLDNFALKQTEVSDKDLKAIKEMLI